MEKAKKMVLVSPELLEKIREHSQTSSKTSTSDTVSALDSEMLRLLNDKTLSDHEKWNQYQQVLQRFLHFKAVKRAPLQVPVVDTTTTTTTDKHPNLDIDEIVGTFPKTYKQDARNFLRAIEKKSELFDWDNDGVVYIRGERIPNSNVIDLLHDIIRTRKSTYPPGWYQLMHLLGQMNMPHEFITNPLCREYLSKMTIEEKTSGTPLTEERSERLKQSILADFTPTTSRPMELRRLDSLYGAPFTRNVDTPSIPKQEKKKPKLLKWEHFTPN